MPSDLPVNRHIRQSRFESALRTVEHGPLLGAGFRRAVALLRRYGSDSTPRDTAHTCPVHKDRIAASLVSFAASLRQAASPRSWATGESPHALVDGTPHVARWRAAIYLLYACLIAAALFADLATRPIWLDEALSYFQVRDRNLAALFHSFEAGVNAVPYGYFLVLWGVDHLFGLGPLALRLPSAVFGFAGVVLLHNLIRRHFGDPLAFASCVAALILSPEFMLYTHEARPYSLYFLLAVLSLYTTSALARADRPGWVALAANAAVAFVLPSVHYVGLPYSAASAVALLSLRRDRDGAVRIRIAASYVIGWTLFAALHVDQILLFLTGTGAIRADWIPRSATWDVFNALKEAALLLPAPLPLVLLGFALIALSRAQPRPSEVPRPGLSKAGAVVVLACVLWVPMAPLLHGLSALGLPTATLPRYFAPGLGAIAVVSAFILYTFQPAVETIGRYSLARAAGVTAVAVSAAFLVYPLVSDVRAIVRAPHAISQRALERDFAYIAQSPVPSVTNNIHVFFPYAYYSTARNLALLRETRREVAGIRSLDDGLSAMLAADLERWNRFQFVNMPGSRNSYPGFDIRAWAPAHGYVATETGNHGDIRVFDVRRKSTQ